MECPNCAAEVEEGDRFCESCGTPLKSEPAAVPAVNGKPCSCGATADEVDDQGYCTVCGKRRPMVSPRDHKEIVLSPAFAAVTDRGIRHNRNEDDVTLGIEERDGQPTYVIVVCDGVSSSEAADSASATAAQTAQDSLRQAVRENADPEVAMDAAIRAAHQAVCAIKTAQSPDKDPPETTLVAAIVSEQSITVGWVGDSRAYWLAPDRAEQWTHDHSWVNEVVDSGQMSEEEAMQSRQAHAITLCLGAPDEDSPDGIPTPSVKSYSRPTGGLLLVCTDGLWNYAGQPEQLRAMLQQVPAQSDNVVGCRHLVDFALSQGGRDNITVALLSL